MLFLGIETSCDETAAAVVRDGHEVLSNEVASSAAQHNETGGVVPEVAARAHVGAVLPTIDRALEVAGVSLDDIDAIAVTQGPGLNGSLLSGVATANTLAVFRGKPLYAVNHILGHIRANWLEREPFVIPRRSALRDVSHSDTPQGDGGASRGIQYPIVTLTASGGHNELVLLQDDVSMPVQLGQTLDDAAGEAFDKVARLLGLGYPGGPAIERLAATAEGDVPELPRAWLVPKDISRNFSPVELGQRLRDGRVELADFNFSFSGLKSDVRRRVQAGGMSDVERAQLARGFQDSVIDLLATKLLLAARKYGAKEIHLAGGVSANQALRARVTELAPGCAVRWPVKMSYCVDNAAMIAAAGEWLVATGAQPVQAVDADPCLSFATA